MLFRSVSQSRYDVDVLSDAEIKMRSQAMVEITMDYQEKRVLGSMIESLTN